MDVNYERGIWLWHENGSCFFFSKCRTSHRNTRWSVDPWHDPPSPVYRCDLVIYWWLIYIISKAGNGDPRLFPIRNINIFRGGLQTEPNKIAFFLLFYFNFPFQLMRKKKEKERKKKKKIELCRGPSEVETQCATYNSTEILVQKNDIFLLLHSENIRRYWTDYFSVKLTGITSVT